MGVVGGGVDFIEGAAGVWLPFFSGAEPVFCSATGLPFGADWPRGRIFCASPLFGAVIGLSVNGLSGSAAGAGITFCVSRISIAS